MSDVGPPERLFEVLGCARLADGPEDGKPALRPQFRAQPDGIAVRVRRAGTTAFKSVHRHALITDEPAHQGSAEFALTTVERYT